MLQPNRHKDAKSYRYGFQGQEKDDEIKGEGNSLNYKYRMHDPRVGRFFAVDPLAPDYPYYSQYAFSGNRVIDAFELEGLEPFKLNDDGKTYVSESETETTETAQYLIKTNKPHPYFNKPNPITEIFDRFKDYGTGELLKLDTYKTKEKIRDRPYSLSTGVSLPNKVTALDEWNCTTTCTINFGNGFKSDKFASPENKINKVAVDGFIQGIQLAIKNGADIKTITITATTNGHHGNGGSANWHKSSSNHYVKNGATAIDVNFINGMKPNSSVEAINLSLIIQTQMDKVKTIRENFGVNFKHKLGKPKSRGSGNDHLSWMHFSFR